MSAPLRLSDPAAALEVLLSLVAAPVAPTRMPIADAVGCVLAEPLVVNGPVPALPVAARDGWAVRAVDTDSASPYAPAVLPMPPGRAAPGDRLPAGADAVLAPFELSEDGSFATAVAAVAPGEGVRRPGEEIAPGAALRGTGERLAARDLPALAALGIVEVAVRRAAANPSCLLVNRNAGSGTRILLDGLLGGARHAGYANQPKSHNAVAAAVAQGRADWGVAIATVARAYGLGFLPLADEMYDFFVPESRASRPAVAAFLAALRAPAVERRLRSIGFTVETGTAA